MMTETEARLSFIDTNNECYEVELTVPRGQQDILDTREFNLFLERGQLPDELDTKTDYSGWEMVISVGNKTEAGRITDCDNNSRAVEITVDSAL